MLKKWFLYGLHEIKFLRSFNDVKLFYNQKLTFFLIRLIGSTGTNVKAPPSLQIEPTNFCNINCICCPTDRMVRKKGHMDFELFRKIIDEASKIGVRRVHLLLHGEPMIHPRIVDMIRYIKSKSIAINLTTNGMLFSKEKIEYLYFAKILL